MEVTSVSRRYAGALFDFAGEQDSRDDVRSDCAAISSLYDASAEFAAFVKNPTIAPEEASAMLDTLFRGKAHSTTLKFLQFLVSKGRLDQLPLICEVYEALICEMQDIIKVEITAAHQLTETQLSAMKQKLHDRYQKQIEADVEVDPSLIGGFKIKVGDHIRDFSLATKLDQFEQSVINA